MNESNELKDQTFGKLLQELATLAAVPELASQKDHAQIEVDGIYFTIIEGGQYDRSTFSYFCDFGAVPNSGERAEILQRLLESNLLMAGHGAPTFAVNFETQHVLLVGRAHLSEVNAQRLLNAFAQYAEQARQWRQGYFLEGQRKTQAGSQQQRLRAALQA